jgi:hypothetical protein
VARLLQYFCSPPLANQLGFTQGKQCAELSEFVRLALQKSSQWGIDLFVLKLDVFKAFDTMRHDTILESLIDCQCPVKLQHAVMCELAHGTIALKFQGESWDGLRYSRGGRQGGAETPELWKRVLNVAVSRAKVRWDLLGLPAVFGDRGSPEDRCDIDFLAWEDDLALFSNTLDGIHSMFKILDEELHRVFLSIKPGSLELLRCGGGWVAKEFVWGGACGISHTISLRENMVLLGVAVDSVGSAVCSLEHRMAQGWVHWHARKNCFVATSFLCAFGGAGYVKRSFAQCCLVRVAGNYLMVSSPNSTAWKTKCSSSFCAGPHGPVNPLRTSIVGLTAKSVTSRKNGVGLP